jgi:hypothetical protein
MIRLPKGASMELVIADNVPLTVNNREMEWSPVARGMLFKWP